MAGAGWKNKKGQPGKKPAPKMSGALAGSKSAKYSGALAGSKGLKKSGAL